jgi:hypothetical protein
VLPATQENPSVFNVNVTASFKTGGDLFPLRSEFRIFTIEEGIFFCREWLRVNGWVEVMLPTLPALARIPARMRHARVVDDISIYTEGKKLLFHFSQNDNSLV